MVTRCHALQMNKLKAYSLLASLLYFVAGYSQASRYLWCNELGEQQGLTSSAYNFYVFSDSEGFAWVSSTKGLNRFDGQNIKPYRNDMQDTTALFGENIQSRFFEDDRQDLWFCTYEAIHRYNRCTDNFSHYFVRNENGERIEEDYQVFYLERDSFLWLRAGQNIYRVDISNPQAAHLAFDTSSALCSTKYYHPFVGTTKAGVVRYIFSVSNEKRKGVEFFEFEQGDLTNQRVVFNGADPPFPDFSIYQVYFEDDRHVWFSSDKGLVCWDLTDDGFKIHECPYEGYSYFVPFDAKHFIVSFYQSGLYWFDRDSSTYQPFDVRTAGAPNQTAGNGFRNLYLDEDKVLWITVPEQGLLYTMPDKRKFAGIPIQRHSTEDLHYLELFPYQNDQVIVGHSKGILICDKQGNVQADIPINEPGIKNIFRSSTDDNFWITTRNGLVVGNLKKNSFQKIPASEGIDFTYVYQLKNGTILASSLFQGVYQINEQNGFWQIEPAFAQNNGGIGYTTIFQDSFGKIYICRNEAEIEIFRYKNHALIPQGSLDIKGAVNVFHEDLSGNDLWIGTSFGLRKINKTTLEIAPHTFSIPSGLADNNVFSIVQGDSGELWISSNQGLYMLTATGEVRNFSLLDGMLSERFRIRSGTRFADGTIWFGGANGITIVPPGPVSYIPKIPQIVISEIKVGDEVPDSIICRKTGSRNVNQIQQLAYDYQHNTLSFHFVATDYSAPNSTHLRYKMAGIDEQFVSIEAGESGFARYAALSPGNYEFVVEGLNSDGALPSRSERRVAIAIHPPFWETWWFRLLIGLFVVLTVVWLSYSKIKRVREKEQLKTRIAENKMSALIAQMDPHFIFNSLQSINRFILQKDRKLASEYLGRFSGLIRMMLENSRNTKHLLNEELQFLDLYMQVETQRFKIPFTYTINVTKDLEYSAEIPTMMLQPFVENAIWHGLWHKEEGVGHIQIDIHRKHNLLHCVIEDNGIGRKKASQKASEQQRKVKSRGLEIVQERLQLFFPDQQELTSIIYTDLYNEQGNPVGTRVEIRLPLEE